MQKSYQFLLPLAGFYNNEAIKPDNTYLYWSGGENIENFDLIVHYKDTAGDCFKQYERKNILINQFLTACYEVEEGSVYIFDLGEWAKDVMAFLDGKYSTMTYKARDKICAFHNEFDKSMVAKDGRPLHTVLYPQYYYELVAAELEVPLKTIRDRVELCDKFNKQKETLNIKIINKGECSNVPQISNSIIKF